MYTDTKGKGVPAWHAGAEARLQQALSQELSPPASPRLTPAPVVEGDPPKPGAAKALALEPLRVGASSCSSSSSLSATFSGRLVQRVERKSCEPEAPPALPGCGNGTPARPSRLGGLGSPEMARFHALSKHLGKLPLARHAAQDEEGGSDGRLRRQMAQVITQAQLHTGGEPSLSACCSRLLAVRGCGPAMVGLVAGVMALELRAPLMSQADRQRLLDDVIAQVLGEAAGPGAENLAVGIFQALCEAFHGTGHWMPQAAPFVHMVLDRVLAPAGSTQSTRLLQAFTNRMLLVEPPALLPRFLAQVLDQPFLSIPERSDRLRVLLAGAADKPVNDACLGQLLGHALHARYPHANRAVVAAELARCPGLWERACQPGMLDPAAFGRLLLARGGDSAQDGKAEAAGKLPPAAGQRALAVSTTTQAGGIAGTLPGTPIETKSGTVLPAGSSPGWVALVRDAPLSLGEGKEGRLAREILGIHRALEATAEPGPAREALKARILGLAPGALPLTNVAMACGWALAQGAQSMGDQAFEAMCQSFELAPSVDGTAWADAGSLEIGLAAARDIHGLVPLGVADPQTRIQVVRVCREAVGPLDDARFGAELSALTELSLEPAEAVFWLGELARQFAGPDFSYLATASACLQGYIEAVATQGSLTEEGLTSLVAHAAKLHQAAYRAVSRRYEQCLWISDPAEREAVLAMALLALKFLAEEDAFYRDPEAILPVPGPLLDGLAQQMKGLDDAIDQLAGTAGEQSSGTLVASSQAPAKHTS